MYRCMYIVILIRGIKEKKMIFYWWLVYIFLEALNSIKVWGNENSSNRQMPYVANAHGGVNGVGFWR